VSLLLKSLRACRYLRLPNSCGRVPEIWFYTHTEARAYAVAFASESAAIVSGHTS